MDMPTWHTKQQNVDRTSAIIKMLAAKYSKDSEFLSSFAILVSNIRFRLPTGGRDCSSERACWVPRSGRYQRHQTVLVRLVRECQCMIAPVRLVIRSSHRILDSLSFRKWSNGRPAGGHPRRLPATPVLAEFHECPRLPGRRP